MRTSRISRDTAAALAARRAAPERSTRLERFRAVAGRAAKNGYRESEDEDFESSSEGDGEGSEFEGGEDVEDVEEREGDWPISESEEEEEEEHSGSRKRKRGAGKENIAATKLAPARKRGTTSTKPLIKKEKDGSKGDPPKKARRSPTKKSLTTTKTEPPENWEEMYALTAAMRATRPAPVDTMGCETLADPTTSPLDQRFQTLIALMLSSQTKDTVTAAAIATLHQTLPGGLSLASVLAVAPDDLNALIGKVGFHNLKTKYIKSTALILQDKFGGDIPDSIAGLTSLPGVGPKMAYLCMSAAWGRDEGIGVDVHVHRITNLWGWHETRTPEETRAALEAWLPRDKWHGINGLLVGFGQTVCLPVGRRCGECTLAERGLCPSAVVGREVRKKKVVKREVVQGEVVVKEEVEVVEERDVKAEEVEDVKVEDIEDLGRVGGGRRARSRR